MWWDSNSWLHRSIVAKSCRKESSGYWKSLWKKEIESTMVDFQHTCLLTSVCGKKYWMKQRWDTATAKSPILGHNFFGRRFLGEFMSWWVSHFGKDSEKWWNTSQARNRLVCFRRAWLGSHGSQALFGIHTSFRRDMPVGKLWVWSLLWKSARCEIWWIRLFQRRHKFPHHLGFSWLYDFRTWDHKSHHFLGN